MRIIDYIKKVLVMMFVITGTIHAAPPSFCSLQNNTILPEGYREVLEVITINFDLANTSTTPCPATDRDDGTGLPNMSINIALDKLIPELLGGVPNVTGAILDYFDVSYDAVNNELNLIQKADVPPNTSNSGTFYVEITGPSITESDTPNIGYIANLSSIEANTQATNSVENFTLTATHPALELEKTVNTSGLSNPPQAGDQLFYFFTITNTGDSLISDVLISDPRIGLPEINIGNLDVGESFTFTDFFGNPQPFPYTVTQADIDSGSVVNSATTSGTDIQDRNVTDLSDDPTDPSNVDTEGDGEPDDPTVVYFAPPSVLVGDATVTEGTALVFDVNLSRPSTEDINITLSTADITAEAGSDYDATTITVTIPAGSTGTTITVPSIQDTIDEIDETFSVSVTGTTGGAVGDTSDTGTGTILDDDVAPTIVSVTSDEEREGDLLEHNITLSGVSGVDQTYAFVIADNTATQGVDYNAGETDLIFSDGVTYNESTGEITVPAGITFFTVQVPTNDDTDDENDEIYDITVDGLAATGTILDNDGVLPISLSYVYPVLHGSSLDVEFITATEMGNIGFNVYGVKGKKWIKLNEELIEGALDSFKPIRYQVSLNVPEKMKFKKIGIAGVDVNGYEERHGPFTIGHESGVEVSIKSIDWKEVNRQVKADKKARKEAKKLRKAAKASKDDTLEVEASAEALVGSVEGEMVSLDVTEDGLYRITHEDLLAAGVDLNKEKVRNIAISFREEGVVRHIANDKNGKWTQESYIEFEGEAPTGSDTLYVAANTYQLSRDRGLVVASGPLEPTTKKTLVFETNKNYAYASPSDDPFYDAFFYTINSGSRTFTRTFDLPSMDESSTEMTVYLSALSVDRGHQLQVAINGTEVANLSAYGRKAWPITISIDEDTPLNEGSNTLTLTATGQAEGYDIYIYDKLVFTYDDGESVAPRSAEIRVDEAVSQESIAPQEGTNYVVISHPMFMGEMLEMYINQRSSEGWKVQLVNVEDIYSAYGHGMATPDAIKAYLTEAKRKGVTHVQLVGGSNYDYHDYLGTGAVSFIPSMYVFTEPTLSYTPSDASYVTDDAGVPQMAIGRWPVRTVESLEAVVQKTLSWKDSGQSASHTALFIAEEDEIAGQYAQQMDRMSQSFADTGTWNHMTYVYLDALIKEHTDRASAVASGREMVMASLNEGVSILAYSGHSSPSVWSNDGLLTQSDVSVASNEEKTAIVLPMACYSTYIESPVTDTMAYQLIGAGEQGAVAMYGASLLSTYGKNEVITSQLIGYLLEGDTLGEAVLKTKKSLGDSYRDEILGSSILGDVTLKLR